ncbi:MAG: class II fructose-bisphosphate aldolase [Acidobacteria bacterium]|uniref:Fructose-bisphosphate aldolase n=1 Tax=Candidatus Polarisedimenticola svalbardensis TaxID=2886004 RepID=A0A8J6XUA5_9BACT|nr:class II fructose-bisphosphate aldolase [Candidatus Polarisedimenticola svalbardensis]
MPVAGYETYCKMLDAAQEGGYAYPAINITSMMTINAALKGLAEKKSDGIIQVSTGAGQFASGLHLKDMVLGSITLAEHIHRMAEHYDITVAIHTDHCQADKVDSYLIPLIEESERRVAAGKLPLFSSHMFDGSALPLDQNMAVAVPLFRRMVKINQILEVEAGVVGGEEEGAAGSEDTPAEDLYTTPEDMVEVYRKLSDIDGTFMFAATFGNVHGHYKPGAVKLLPEILKNGQDALQKEFGQDARFHLVFHGGSGSPLGQIRETLGYGVVKMNIDTDTQYAFTRPIVDHMLKNYDAVLMIDGEIGNKKKYDPRSYLKAGEEAMSARIGRACDDLLSTNKSISA